MKIVTAKRNGLLLALCMGLSSVANPAHAQFLKDLKGVIQRGVQDEVKQKASKETRSATRCALGESTNCPHTITRGDENEVAAALESCKPLTFETEHPMVADFTIQHEIRGIQNGRCMYVQSMPSDMKMICAFTEAGRKEAAAEFRKTMETGRYQGSTQDMPGFTKECEIEMANGYRMPANGMTSGGQ